MSDLAELCREIGVLRRALTAAGTPGQRPDQSCSSILVTAVLAATPRRDVQTRRSVPGSRPPGGDDLLNLALTLDRAIVATANEWRRQLGHTRRHITPGNALDALPKLGNALPDVAVRRAFRLLDNYRKQAIRTLGIGRKWIMIGACPVPQEPYPAEWDEAGTTAVTWWDDGLCRVYTPAMRDGRIQDAWARSILRVDAQANAAAREGDIVCPGCRTRWPSDQWMHLGTVLREGKGS